ncbi:hypothetical protein [Rhizobium alvei]|uniref:Uncharacterized protein n=1 Tax=Rhizobium alvei TaxID=1132659 RepID=A0ABT8YTC7_9HYPH|nr:hypothetical protein [Rhizobium alvei]MDO6966475.1 hypothetical protein [Rhizobium alvei]
MTEVPQSIRLIARLAEVMARPAEHWPQEMTGLATMPPDTVSGLYRGSRSALFQKALAIDLKLADIKIDDSFMVDLRTVPDMAHAVRIACAPIAEIMVALRHLAACIYCKAVNGAVRKSDREAMLDMLGVDGLLTAQRQADVFWPSLSGLAAVTTGLATTPAEPPTSDGPWHRPSTSKAITARPPALQHAYAVLLGHVNALSETVSRILQARLGTVPASYGPQTLSPQQDRDIRDLLERKVPTWSTTIA